MLVVVTTRRIDSARLFAVINRPGEPLTEQQLVKARYSHSPNFPPFSCFIFSQAELGARLSEAQMRTLDQTWTVMISKFSSKLKRQIDFALAQAVAVICTIRDIPYQEVSFHGASFLSR